MSEQWITVDEVIAAKERLRAAMPGYEQPVSYSVAWRSGGGWVFAHINEVGGTHELPAVVLATVTGHRRGNVTIAMTEADFADAIELLRPAEACSAFDHPNLWSWRPLLRDAPANAEFVAVFIEDLDAPAASDAELALRDRLRST